MGFSGKIIGMGHHQQMDGKDKVVQQLHQIGVDAVVTHPIPKRELLKILSNEELSVIGENQVGPCPTLPYPALSDEMR